MKKLIVLAMGLVVCGMRAEEAQKKEKETLLYHMIVAGSKSDYKGSEARSIQLKMYAKTEEPHNQNDAEKVLQDSIKAAESDLNLFRYDNINVREEYNYFKEQRKKQIAEKYNITTQQEHREYKH